MNDVGCGTRFRVDAETTAKRCNTVWRGAAAEDVLSQVWASGWGGCGCANVESESLLERGAA